MLRLRNLSNKNRRRTLRALYAQTQATPYAARLDDAFDRTVEQVAGAKTAILPGSVMVKLAGEVATLSGAHAAGQRAMGLCANFVGGEMDELGDEREIGVYRGPASVFEVLSPAFDDTGLAAAATAEAGTPASEVHMNSGADGRLVTAGAGASAIGTTARLIERLSDKAIIIELLV